MSKDTIMRGKLLSEILRFHSEITDLSVESMDKGAVRVLLVATGLQTATVQAMAAFEKDDPGVIQVVRENSEWLRDSRARVASSLQKRVDELEGELAVFRAQEHAQKATDRLVSSYAKSTVVDEAVEVGTRAIEKQESDVPDSFKEAHPGLSPVSLVTAWRMQQARTVEAAGIEID
jgi:rhamnose utilization protein RhaD (predicted bifunctional aldolase and dehydrogenase)